MMGNKTFKVVLSLTVLSLATFALLGGFNLVKSAFAQPQETKKVQQWEYCYMSVPQPGKDGSYVTISRGDHQEALDSDTTGCEGSQKRWALMGGNWLA